MRQIKLRAWDKNSGKYIDLDRRHNGILYHKGELHISQGWDGVGLPTFFFSEDDINYHQRDCIFEQFTGLLDKNGKEIYEGDIVEYVKGCGLFSNLPTMKQPEYGDMFIVVNLKSGFTLVPQKSYHDMPKTCDGELIPNVCGYICNYDFWNGQRSLKVIGNIHTGEAK